MFFSIFSSEKRKIALKLQGIFPRSDSNRGKIPCNFSAIFRFSLEKMEKSFLGVPAISARSKYNILTRFKKSWRSEQSRYPE